MKRRFLMAIGGAVAVAISGLAVTVLSAETPREQSQSRAELERLQDRIDLDIRPLARQGVYVRTTGLAARCVSVLVDNLTVPNKTYLARRYGAGACLRQASSIPGPGCSLLSRRDSGQSKTVPDMFDLGLYEAERRLVAAEFAFSIECPGKADGRPSRPSRYSPDALVRVTRQCPAAGATLAAGAPVALQAEAILPGGHRYVVGAFRGHVECTNRGLEGR
ncbi:MAG TPA: hypothetical protein VK501_23925 [Baekduia sp.]|uniref:hypothetical protein n=1 Tax=Baekduia sp. TaxID=2600305 RepID=UPI002B6B1796|nr:hypothetical protein [Baekduia sp.]HMJ36976.1 hypothetical protein [Baekduia sp.]